MEKFSETRRCPKCRQAATTGFVRGGPMKGKMMRKCIRCDFIWYEQPLDADE